MLTFKDGQIKAFEKIRTHKRAVDRLKELVMTQIARDGDGFLSIMHADVEDEAQELAGEMCARLGLAEVPILAVPPAVVTHGGPGVLGVGFFYTRTGANQLMNIRILDTANRRDVRKFVEFPFTLYENCPQWMPPLVSGVKATLDRRRFPFYRHSDADFFVAEDAGTVVGRIAVLENRRYNDYNRRKAAFFYHFDVIDDADVARALFDAAADWAAQRGLTMLYGPKGFLRSDAPGILIKGFEHRAALSMPYNYAYYPRLMEAAGFEKEIDYLSGYVERGQDLDERFYALAEKIKARRGFSVKTFKSKRELRAWIPKIQKVNNEAFTEVWGYYPIDDAEVQMIGKQLLSVANPRLMKVVMKGDDIAGFAFVFPDISDALKQVRGRLWPFGWIRVLWAMRTTRRMSGNGVGLLPEYQGMGGSTLLYVEFAKTLKAADATHCDLAQAMETNVKSLGDMNAIGAQWYKRHRVYRRAI